MCFKFADDIAAVIAAKQGRLPPCTTVVGKVELLTARVCFFALSNVEAIERHAETIEQRRRTVGTVPDSRLCRTRFFGPACEFFGPACEFVRSKSLLSR